MNLGEVVVIDNVKSQCLGKGNSVFYRETVCGIMGQPECDKIDLPTGFKEATEKEEAKPRHTEVNVPGLPKGWKVLDESRQEVPGTNGGHIISRTLMFQPILGNSRARRQSGHGVGSVIGIEDVGTEKPPMPMSMLLNGGKASSAGKPKQSGTSVQSVSSTLNVKGNSKDRVAGVGTGSGDLHSRTPTASNTKGLKPESVSGSRSDVDWKGKTISVNGRTVAAGPGTFSFGSSPTGAFLKKDN
ncbi:unnamed protein product [Heligmosomoides polygyrus]|uniref:Uncharacterized protein n=1 Tax=Heligmosomoides polygyrus TaxID=6339 RepID=A0A3P8DYJ2_HELPZ|nr:unnamed protein product [Heligmosomoides polygyrus]